MSELSLIEETFSWLHSVDADKITLENYDGNVVNLKEDNNQLNDIILNGISLDNNIIAMDSIINIHLRNNSRFCYILRYYAKNMVYEILIYDDGTVKFEDKYYFSPILLSAAQACLPIINEDQNEIQTDVINVMLNSYIATYTEYKKLDVDKSDREQCLTELWDNAVRLRASAYFIKENMIKTEDVDESKDMHVLKSTGYSGGKKVDMYIYSVEDGTISHVNLVYNNHEYIYVFDSEADKDSKSVQLIKIWTAS